MDTRDQFRSLAAQRGFTAEEIEGWLREARVHTELSSGPPEGAIPGPGIVAGRVGGLPRLPVGSEWPRGCAPYYETPLTSGGRLIREAADRAWPIPFFCSVDCAALPSETDLPFPAGGTLLFFVEQDYLDPIGRVVYVPEGVETVEQSPPEPEPEPEPEDDEDMVILPEQDLYAFVTYSWPPWLLSSPEDGTDLEPEEKAFHARVPRAGEISGVAAEIWREPPFGWTTVKLGSHHYAPQGYPEHKIAEEQIREEYRAASREDALQDEEAIRELARERGEQLALAKEWVTLGVFEIPDNESFYASFLIHRDDLAACRFDDVRFFVEH
ncbi:DUF1963 domain-containing protein [Streptomyces sedi]|uniref:DUF1963 domain-containing protein n=1 Tax=Streptomyces sedi TaxID=555059 RepID=A0A5C4VC16_9ACTN|nr:DUF1963 domain-containing protein [Streptomyces sedi]TNM33342.1 DUF1963 domain-containing protein [Streptomyces sedi]